MSRKLLKSGLIVSFMTLLSRVLGLVRDVVVANLMGATAAADVFIFANKIPNFLRRLFAEGAFAQAFVPVLTEVEKQGDDAAFREFIAKTAGTLGVIVLVVSLIGVVASPVLVALFGVGWFVDYVNDGANSDNFVLASLMLKITFPYLLFVSLAGLAGAVLNTLNKFAPAAFTPVLLNVVIISCAIFLSPHFSQPAFAIAWGVFIGGFFQLAFQLPFLWRAKALPRPKWGWRDPNVVKVRRLMIPALFGVSVGQLNMLFDTIIATSFLATGSISWLYYSDRLLEFPLGLFGIAIATVILPTLSRNHVSSDARAFAASMDWAVKMICLLGIPAAAGLMMLAEPMLLVIFQRGAFTPADAHAAGLSLVAYGAGLWFLMMVKVLAPGFYSRQDTKTPVRYGIICMLSNMLFNVIFAIPFGYVGLAMATTASAALNAGLLYRKLRQQGVYQLSLGCQTFALQVIAATLLMVAALQFVTPEIAVWLALDFVDKAWRLSWIIATGGGVFVLSLLLLGVRPASFRNPKVS